MYSNNICDKKFTDSQLVTIFSSQHAQFFKTLLILLIYVIYIKTSFLSCAN